MMKSLHIWDLVKFLFIPPLSRKYYHIYNSIDSAGGNTMNWTGIALFIQLFFGIVIGLVFLEFVKKPTDTKGYPLIGNQEKKWNNCGK